MEKTKNCWVIPTDKPSRLHLGNSGLILCDLIFNSGTINSQHIYITNDEEINKDTKTCWSIDISCNKLVLHQGVLPSYHYKHYKKIIMTTDKSINVLCSCGKDCGAKESGVQSIDDEFLEWFVNNPSCEEVEVKLENYYASGALQPNLWQYKVIIPKDEPKQERERGITITHVGKPKELEEAKKETLEEVAANLADPNICKTDNWIAGAKWQAERMYSEEDMAESFMACWKSNVPEGAECKLSFNDWYEQFKKK